MLLFFTNLRPMELLAIFLSLFLHFYINRRLRVALCWKSSQECSVNASHHTLFLLHINIVSAVVCKTAIFC